MEKILAAPFAKIKVKPVASALIGSLFLALMSQVSVPLPFTPVPMTMQTFGVLCLAITLGGRGAAFAVLAYLLEGSLGLPVFAKNVPGLWFMGPTAGYLIGFVAAAYVLGSYLETARSSFAAFCAMFGAELLILALGSAWLAIFLGPEMAFNLGAMPFVAMSVLKAGLATITRKAWNTIP